MISLQTDSIESVVSSLYPEALQFIAQQKSKSQNAYAALKRMPMTGFLHLVTNPEGTVDQYGDLNPKLKGITTVAIIGIGGSMLGPQMLINALGINNDLEFLYLDNVDPFTVYDTVSHIDFKRTLFIVTSKSGGTLETISNYLYIKEKLHAAGKSIQERVLFITEDNGGFLAKEANENEAMMYLIPEQVGGRFSVLSPVGILPAMLGGINVEELLQGGLYARSSLVDEAFEYALWHFTLYKYGFLNSVLMPYVSRLKTFSEWYVQLLAESVGKITPGGDNVGIMPVPAIGVTDQHSKLQLLEDGPNNCITNFITVKEFPVTIPITDSSEYGFEYLRNRTFADVSRAEYLGTRDSLTHGNRPTLTVEVDKLDEYHMGMLIMFYELAVSFTGMMFEINPFDQPGVERSKKIAKQILQG